jgi:uncharacterized protein (TIGR02099 family)
VSTATLQRLIKIVWQLLALGLLLFALLVSLIRGLLPHVPEVRQQLVEYLQHEYKVKVQLESITAQWRAFGPELVINQLVIPPQASLPITLMVEKVLLKVDFWDSLASFSPQIETVTFDGLDLAYDLSHQAIAQLPTAADMANSPELINSPEREEAQAQDWLYGFALEQLSHFSITNASVQLLSDQRKFKPIFINNLVWLNTPNLHRGEGQLLMDKSGASQQNLSLKLEISGNGYQADSLVGQVYLQANELDLGQWLSGKTAELDFKRLLQVANLDSEPEHPKIDGKLNFEAWLELSNRSLASGLLVLKPSSLQWQWAEVTERFSIESGQFELVSTPEGWQVNSHELKLMTNQQVWPEMDIGVRYQDDAFFAYLNELSLPLLTPLLALVPELSAEQLTQWQTLGLSGTVGPIRGYHSLETGLIAKTRLSQVAWSRAEGMPGMSPIDAALSYDNHGLNLSLPAQDYSLDFGTGFDAPLVFHGEALSARYELTEQRLAIPRFAFDNQDISLAGAVGVSLTQDTHLSLAAKVKVKQAENLGDYFPLAAMSPELVEYLNGAIIKGQIPDASVVWHGALSHYPYEDNSGVFQAGFTLENAVYRFEPDWPVITELSLDALFENAAMDLWVTQGQLQDVAIDGAHVYIPELGEHSLLRVEAKLNTQALAATRVLQASPLKDSVGETLNSLQVRGAISARLDLNIPLYEGEEERIAGNISFNKNNLLLTGPELEFTDLTGEVSFINQELLGKGLKAKLLGQGLVFSFATEERDDKLALAVDLQGKVVMASLPQAAANPVSEYYQGSFEWDGAMSMVFEPDNYQLQLQLNSDLMGTEINLPAPFNKPANAPLGLEIELFGGSQSSTVNAKFAELAEFRGEITPESGNGLSHYDFMLGRAFTLGETLTGQQGHIQIALDKAELAPWLPLIEQLTLASTEPTGEEAEPGVFPPLQLIRGKVNQFELPGLWLHAAEFSASPSADKWLFKVNSEEFIGDISLYPDWQQQGLELQGEKLALSTQALGLRVDNNTDAIAIMPPQLKLTPLEADSQPATLGLKPAPQVVEAPAPSSTALLPHVDFKTSLADLPKLKIDVADFSFNGMPLGQLQLEGAHNELGYQFSHIGLTKPGLSFNATGLWSLVAGQERSEFELDLQADKFDILSESLLIEPGVKDSPVMLKGNLSWQAAPHEFVLSALDGKLAFELGKGHLSEISDKGARIFSLFSLDSLLRKLSFDFSDVFGQGLYFNEFKGDLTIDKGVLKTRNTEMDAIAGDMKVRGYTDLSSQSLNYDIRFVPQLASSVPTVVLLSTSAWTFGVGAFALTKVLEPMIEIISEIRFRVTGTMDEPLIEELERKHKEIEIPEAILAPKVGDQSQETLEMGKPADASNQSQGQTKAPTPAKPIADDVSLDVPALVEKPETQPVPR